MEKLLSYKNEVNETVELSLNDDSKIYAYIEDEIFTTFEADTMDDLLIFALKEVIMDTIDIKTINFNEPLQIKSALEMIVELEEPRKDEATLLLKSLRNQFKEIKTLNKVLLEKKGDVMIYLNGQFMSNGSVKDTYNLLSYSFMENLIVENVFNYDDGSCTIWTVLA